jgi:CBS domain-containing protein
MGRVIRDIMKSKVVSVSADDTLWTVKEIMELGSVRHLPVVRKGELIGVVSQRDLLRASLSSVMGIEGSEHRVFLEQVRISDVMSSDPISISTGQSIRGAARIMAERKIGSARRDRDGDRPSPSLRGSRGLSGGVDTPPVITYELGRRGAWRFWSRRE